MSRVDSFLIAAQAAWRIWCAARAARTLLEQRRVEILVRAIEEFFIDLPPSELN